MRAGSDFGRFGAVPGRYPSSTAPVVGEPAVDVRVTGGSGCHRRSGFPNAACSVSTGITADAGTVVREAIDKAVADDPGERVRFPAVVAFGDDLRDCLPENFHRFEACRRAGRDAIEADVYVGTRDDGLWFRSGRQP